MEKINIVSGVYLIKYTPTGATYIGSSFNIHHRFEQHMAERTKWFESTKEDYELYLLQACGEESLRLQEQFYINYLQPSLNINTSTTKPPIRHGEDNNKAIYDEQVYATIFLLLASGETVASVVSSINASKDVVKNIYSLKSHKYLHDKYPLEYVSLLEVKARRNKTLPINVYHEKHGVHTLCSPFSNFCTKFNLPNNGNIGRLYSGTRKSYLGWTVLGE